MKTKIFRLLFPAMVALLSVQLYAKSENTFGPAVPETRSKASIKHDLVCRFETVGMAGSGEYAPFWHTSNRQGLPSVNRNSGFVHFAAMGSMLLPSGFVMGYGMDMGIGASLQSGLFVHQLYIDLDYKWLRMSVGMKERWSELKNPCLSSGGLTWSGNSKPIPQVRMETPDYVRIPLLGDWFSVKGHVAYGLFTDSKWRGRNPDARYTDGLLFHSKAAFIRFGDVERFPLHATLGLEMYAQFGGTMHNRGFSLSEAPMDEYKFPSGAREYLDILLPFNVAGEQTKENGNTLGSWHLSIDWIGEDWGCRAYYEHFFEDHSSMLGVEYKSDLNGKKEFVSYGFRRNWLDGLYGIEVNLPESLPVRNVLFEVLNTKGQCGPVYKPKSNSVIVEGVDGRDGYYYHEIYDSYSMWGYAIGNPAFISPVYNDDDSQVFKSNRLIMVHAGLSGGIGSHFDYRFMFSYSKHWGTYDYPYYEVGEASSYMLEGAYRFGDALGWRVGLSVGMDTGHGTPLGNNKGVMLSISKLWRIL